MCSAGWLEPRGEVAQLPGLGDDSHAGQVASLVGDRCDDLGQVVRVALGVVAGEVTKRTGSIAARSQCRRGAWPTV